ncbi:MAG: hypothetical protein COZ37_00055 [bacterium (Candidatus Ratteibacteria) CG_4_10_14_3_um_filter_41_18]|uniref:Glycosyltransferase family 9 protein n=1 Tax=bacterium (Candidatus Ratteibacteria) CG_4_10_14_3_um_filter_41_18 TaxID=2014287 RepID=A0A2M7M5I5_9BACT|nr:MAG: hypothetical protein COZ37_00055 [bacterium (Candidatus Ratteibacteria) CG_4_10_14_3_um_filter_41_18]
MKIVQIVPEMEVGGVEQGTYDLARGLLEKGHQSIIISHGGRLISGLKALGVKHYLLPVHRKSPLIMARMVKKVRKILQEENIEILHARSRVPAWLGYYACRNLKRALFITNDTGPMHLASAVKCPVVAIYGPGNWLRYGPWENQYRIVHSNLSCSPCNVIRCKRNFLCRELIKPADVLQAAESLLK